MGKSSGRSDGRSAVIGERLLRIEGLVSLPGIQHAFETRAKSLRGALPEPLARVQQVHGTEVLRLPREPDSWRPFLEPRSMDRPPGDALITDAPGVTVAVAVADCLPILIADPEHRAVAAVHGGWRGLAADIVAAALARMGEEFGSRPADCLVGIGPGIGACCYEVGPEVLEAFAAIGMQRAATRLPRQPPDDAGPVSTAKGGYCDLSAVAAAEAHRFGVPEEKVFALDLCTCCHGDELWSYRLEGSAAGRTLAGIAVTR